MTHGHLDVIARAAGLFDEVVVAVGRNSAKNYLFPTEERVDLVRQTTSHLANVSVEPLDGLLVDFARAHGAGVLVKGIRFASDFDFELQMAHINQVVGSVETVMLPASSVWSTLSSTMVREVASFGGDVSAFVPEVVASAIRRRTEGWEQRNG
ncbi:MAG: pantetheine-phosphate adenylyltransferase [Propionicimonas sp.]|uniref:pantetheine-phosphate adenylyltransferase n=1 Tax=Propionicimonas sp. TaxID=1955623 RepID=UPI003D12CDCB